MSEEIQPEINRREIMRRAVMLVGGGAALAALGACEREQEVLPSGNRLRSAGRYFSGIRMTRLYAICDMMIPKTATPGALEAGVPQFIDAMMADWAAPDTRESYDRIIDEIDARAVETHGDRLTRLAAAEQLETLRAHDREALSRGDGAYRNFKELILLGYYHSEPGATVELQYQLIPGKYIACAPIEEVGGRAWAD